MDSESRRDFLMKGSLPLKTAGKIFLTSLEEVIYSSSYLFTDTCSGTKIFKPCCKKELLKTRAARKS